MNSNFQNDPRFFNQISSIVLNSQEKDEKTEKCDWQIVSELKNTPKLTNYPCPCCGYMMFSSPPGSGQTCEICGWTDDLIHMVFVDLPGGPCGVSFLEAQSNYFRFGAVNQQVSSKLRSVSDTDRRDPLWTPLDIEKHPFLFWKYFPDQVRWESIRPSEVVLYYWKPDYWLYLNKKRYQPFL